MDNYLETLYKIQKEREQTIEAKENLAIMPYAEKYCDIDLSTRTINSPEFLSVKTDHKAENIYFKVDRYFDYMDLATAVCIIQYENKNGTGIYVVPYYDVWSESKEGNAKIVFPWCIDGKATSIEGEIIYTIRFYKISKDGKTFLYSLNTQPAKSKILYGMDVKTEDLNGEYDIAPDIVDQIYASIEDAKTEDTYWIEL